MVETQQHITPKTFTSALIEKVGSIGKVLSGFLDAQQSAIQRDLKSEFPMADNDAVHLVLNSFVTLDGTKKPLKLKEIKIQQVPADQLTFCINRLERGRILRLEDDTYELAHDTLAKHIHSQRSAEEIGLLETAGVVKNRWKDFEKTETLMNAKEVDLVSAYIDTLEERMILTPDELAFVRRSIADVRRKRLARRITIAVIMAALTILSILALVSASKARHNEQVAKAAVKRAEELLDQNVQKTFEADRSKYVQLLESGDRLLHRDPPDPEGAWEMFKQASAVAESRPDTMPIELMNSEGNSSYSLAQIAEAMIEVGPRFDSLMLEGQVLENKGYEYYMAALYKYNEAKNLNYNPTRANQNIQMVTDKLPIAFESLRKDGDIYFDVGDKVEDMRGYQDALDKYQQAANIRVAGVDRSYVEGRIKSCQKKLGNVN